MLTQSKPGGAKNLHRGVKLTLSPARPGIFTKKRGKTVGSEWKQGQAGK